MVSIRQSMTVEYGTTGACVIGDPRNMDRDIAYYKLELGYDDVRAYLTDTCATCDGMGTVPYARDVHKPGWAQRRKACPDHVKTVSREIPLPTDDELRAALERDPFARVPDLYWLAS